MKHDPQHAPFYSELGRLNFMPGWARTEPALWPEPTPKFKPAVWRFADAKRALDSSHNMVPAEQTERRNLILVNPIEGNTYASVRSLVAAYQCVMAGDVARTHRHSAAALRLVLQAKPGTYTVVDGARVEMAPGDVVLTPPFKWHGHANESDATSYWIDFLDIPFVQLTEAIFFDPYPDGGLEAVTTQGPTPLRISSDEALGPGRDAKEVEVGKDVMPTIGLHLMRQPAGGHVDVAKSTVNKIYAVISGHPRFDVEGGLSETLGPGDVIAVPCWHQHRIEASDDSTIFRVSDEPIMSKLGLMRTAGD